MWGRCADVAGVWFLLTGEYQPNDDDALRLESKGRHGSCVGGR